MSEVKQGKSADYYEGAADGITEYAEKRDGVMWVGTQGKTLAAALDEVEGIRRAVALVPEDAPPAAPPARTDDGENTPVPQTPPKKDEEDEDDDGNAAENATPRAPRRRR